MSGNSSYLTLLAIRSHLQQYRPVSEYPTLPFVPSLHKKEEESTGTHHPTLVCFLPTFPFLTYRSIIRQPGFQPTANLPHFLRKRPFIKTKPDPLLPEGATSKPTSSLFSPLHLFGRSDHCSTVPALHTLGTHPSKTTFFFPLTPSPLQHPSRRHQVPDSFFFFLPKSNAREKKIKRIGAHLLHSRPSPKPPPNGINWSLIPPQKVHLTNNISLRVLSSLGSRLPSFVWRKAYPEELLDCASLHSSLLLFALAATSSTGSAT